MEWKRSICLPDGISLLEHSEAWEASPSHRSQYTLPYNVLDTGYPLSLLTNCTPSSTGMRMVSSLTPAVTHPVLVIYVLVVFLLDCTCFLWPGNARDPFLYNPRGLQTSATGWPKPLVLQIRHREAKCFVKSQGHVVSGRAGIHTDTQLTQRLQVLSKSNSIQKPHLWGAQFFT